MPFKNRRFNSARKIQRKFRSYRRPARSSALARLNRKVNRIAMASPA